MSARRVIGVDLGGTNVRAALIDQNGTPAGPQVALPSRAKEGLRACLSAIEAAIRKAGAAQAQAVGIAVPGHIQGHIVRWAPNFGEFRDGEFLCWRDVDLGGPLEHALGLPIFMANDANLAALGEYLYGSGRAKAKGLVMITLGTGVGSGVVLSPECLSPPVKHASLLIGGNGGGAELGHTVIVKDGWPCGCGALGCLEAYCGARGIMKTAAQFIPDAQSLTPKDLHQMAESGDARAVEALRQTGEYLGIGLGNIINSFAPEVVAVGGQVAKAGDLILEPARAAARRVAIPSLWPDTRIIQAALSDQAGVLGAAAYALEAKR